MKFRTLLGMAVVGGFLYLHGRRGGTLTIDSLKTTARELFGRVEREAVEVKDRAQKRVVHEVATTVAAATDAP